MQPTPAHTHPDSDAESTPPTSRGRSRLILLFTLLLVLVSIAVLPPLVNVSRFQQRIARNISSALGRPVHFDTVTLSLFPLPGFTLDNFVLDEDPAFGYEPILRADQVKVTLRLSSLLRRHTEFSKISFSSPSVNLVYTHGRWNIESLLLQASHIQAAPTAQRFPGPARRFPYIEATGARLNLKLDQEKSPLTLTDADFALWLPQPHQWHLRLEAHPIRTDTDPGDTGTLRAEGTLGAAALSPTSLAETPIDLHGDWSDAQLGGISSLVLGHDPGLRGDLSLTFALRGTVGRNAISANLQLDKARRADFVPDHPLSLEASCTANAANTFRSFTDIDCHWPPASSSDAPLLALAASLPDATHIHSASATLTLPSVPAGTFFDWLSIATPHPPAVLPNAGTLTGTLTWAAPPPTAALTGEIRFTGGSLTLDPAANLNLPLGDVILISTPSTPSAQPTHSGAPSMQSHRMGGISPQPATPLDFTLQPLSLDLGGKQPATLTAHFDATGYTLHLTGSVVPATLRQLAVAVPQFGDNLAPLLDQISPDPNKAATQTDTTPLPAIATAPPPGGGKSTSGVILRTAKNPRIAPLPLPVAPPATAPISIDLTATRTWGGPQTWTQTTPPPPAHPHRR